MVYHGPSGGCRTCRLRRIKCDQAQPVCNNCVRRQQTCPGYHDVFDGAHRSQNHIVRRQIERHNGHDTRGTAGLGKTTPSSESSVEIVPTISSASTTSTRSKISPRWIAYSVAKGQLCSKPCLTDLPADRSPAADVDMDSSTSAPPILYALKQNVQDTSICFFFGHYAGTAFDPQARNGFNQIWQPLYLRSPAQSPLRLATAAVTVNITMMWRLHGCNSQPARELFTKAVAAAREALSDPCQSSTDAILMTILILDLYEALVLHYAPGPVDCGKHKRGALAIIEHRGPANLATSQGCTLIGAVRHSLLPHLLSSRKPFPDESDDLFDHPSLNETYASNLDQISVQLSRVQSRLWSLRLKCPFNRDCAERRTLYQEIIAEAFRIENLLLSWEANITGSDWLPEYVSRDSVMESIQDAGFYGNRCNVWIDLEFGSLWLLFFIRYLFTLQIIRQAFADENSLLNDPEQRALLSKVNGKVQDLVDSICETIPFHLGDKVTPTNPMHSTEINFPYIFKADPKTRKSRCVPGVGSNHHKRAGASGGWMLFPQLVNVWRFAEPEDDVVPIILREGQLEWIKGQVKRLQKIFLFCEPVWFKRSTPSRA